MTRLIFFLVIDYKEKLNKTLGFNIKSNIGSKPTLLNASHATNFIYEIHNFNGNINVVNSYFGRTKIKDRIKAIQESNGKIVFYKLENKTFQQNLIKIDTQFPSSSNLLFITANVFPLSCFSKFLTFSKKKDLGFFSFINLRISKNILPLLSFSSENPFFKPI